MTWRLMTEKNIPSDGAVRWWREEPKVNLNICRAADYCRMTGAEQFLFTYSDDAGEGYFIERHDSDHSVRAVVREVVLVDGVWRDR